MKFAIVGAGLSGSSILKALLKHPKFKQEDSIDVFEPRPALGPGMPYVPTDDESIMLNIVPDVISVDAQNPNDFVEWLDKNYDEPTNFEGLVPRPRYGKYLVERFSPYYQQEQVTHIQEAVIDLKVLDAQTKQPAQDNQDEAFVFRVKTATGWQDAIYDAVFLAIGRPAYNDFYNLKGTKNYIQNPYPMKEKLAYFENDQELAVIGTGATGIDLMRYIFTHYDLKHPLTYYDVKEPFFCPNIHFEKGDVPYSFTLEWIEQQKEKYGGFIPFQVILDTIQSDLAKVGADARAVYERYKSRTLDVYRTALETNDQELAAVQQHIGRVVRVMDELYNALSGIDRKYYFNHYYEMMSFFKNKVPNRTYKWLFELMDAGKIKAYSTLEDVQVLENGRFQFVTADKTTEADVAINATGFDQNLVSLCTDMPIIKNLYDKRIIMPHLENRFILIDWPQSRVTNQRFGVMDNLFFFGLLIGGTQHENNDAPQIIRHARYAANSFLDDLNR